VADKKYEFNLTARQGEAYVRLNQPGNIALLYVGAKGGGKSWFLCVWTVAESDKLIIELGLKVSANPPIVGFIGRKQAVDFQKTTLETWKRTVPPEAYEIKEQAKEIIYKGRLKLWYGGLDDRETINKFNSAELAFIAIDQAEETERNEVEVLQASLRFKYAGKTPEYKELYTANPAECWLKQDFIDNVNSNKDRQLFYVPALPTDNPHLPTGYADRLKNIFRSSPALVQAYIYGDWSALSQNNSVFSSQSIEALKGVVRHDAQVKKIITCDPSAGGDECVIYVMENTRIVDELILNGERDTTRIAAKMNLLGTLHQIFDYAVDSIGIGQGVADTLRNLNILNRVRAIQSAESADDEVAYINRRAEMWFYASRQVIELMAYYPEDEELRRELTALRYKVTRGRVQIEEKYEARKRLGRSPDRADCWVYGVWASQFVQDISGKDDYFKSKRKQIIVNDCSAMAI